MATYTPTATPTFTPTPTGTPIPSGPVTITYKYDGLSRLEEANYSTGDYYHYSYDAVGNRKTQEKLINNFLTTDSYTYDHANHLKFVNSVEHFWDDNGNLLNDGVNAYQYDAANRLKAFGPTGQTATSTYVYNGLGDRLQETVNGQTTTFTMDLNAGLTQALSDGTNIYIYGVGRIAQVNTGTEYFLGDALGSVRQLANDSGVITYARKYDPYGVVTQTSGGSQTSYGYTGEYTSNDMVYLRARNYTSDTGRFLTSDTWKGDVSSPMSFNRWNYVNGNPINFSDPAGLYSANQIADSYGISVSQLIDAVQTGENVPALYNRWGWINLLLDAHDGQSVEIGSPALFPPFLDMWPAATIGLNSNKITIGGNSLIS